MTAARKALAALALAAAGCSPDYVIGGVEQAAQPQKTTCDAGDWPTTTGEHTRSVIVQGEARPYTLRPPVNYDPCGAAPVLVLLRGEGAFLAPDQSNWLPPFLEAAQQAGFLVVLPEPTQINGSPAWNAPLSPLAAQSIDDVGYISLILADLRGRDTKRTYLTGHGTGGTFAHTLAAQLPAFNAMVVVGGALGGRRVISGALDIPPTPQAPVSALLIHGRDDAIAPIDGGTVGGRVVLGLDAAEAFWAKADNCQAATTLKSNRVTTRYHPCAGGREVTAVALEGVGHWWPDDAVTLHYRATEAIFNFFARHAP